MMYRWRTGAVAWLFHRVSGLALTLYLILHVWVTHHVVQGERSFDRIMGFLSSLPFKVFEIALLAAIAYHTANGIRILIIDFGQGARYHKPLFWGAVAVGLVVFFGLGGRLIVDTLGMLSGQ
jgi:succinate dehydrogenase / fumarate reductase cytochrome b subunit